MLRYILGLTFLLGSLFCWGQEIDDLSYEEADSLMSIAYKASNFDAAVKYAHRCVETAHTQEKGDSIELDWRFNIAYLKHQNAEYDAALGLYTDLEQLILDKEPYQYRIHSKVLFNRGSVFRIKRKLPKCRK